MIKLKRIYNEKNDTDGYRVLVDRIWPRGVSKERAYLNLWLKDIAPSKELRKFFNHEKDKFPEFKQKYLLELQESPQKEALEKLKTLVETYPTVTLIYGAKNEHYNQAVVLKELLEK